MPPLADTLVGGHWDTCGRVLTSDVLTSGAAAHTERNPEREKVLIRTIVFIHRRVCSYTDVYSYTDLCAVVSPIDSAACMSVVRVRVRVRGRNCQCFSGVVSCMCVCMCVPPGISQYCQNPGPLNVPSGAVPVPLPTPLQHPCFGHLPPHDTSQILGTIPSVASVVNEV